MSAYQLLRDAIANQNQVTLFYSGLYRECCPHAIGSKGDTRHVLVFQFAGGSKRGLPLGGEWRCMARERGVEYADWKYGARWILQGYDVESSEWV
jgi:hypothetical protein